MKKILYFFLGSLSIANYSIAQCEPVPAILVSNDTSICEGNIITLSASLNPEYPLGTTAPTSQSLSDDAFTGVIDIGFDFVFYGNTYNQCLISSNNYITFNLGSAGGYSPWQIIGAAPGGVNTPLNSIMCPWQDILPSVGGVIRHQTIGTAPYRVFVVEYCNIPMFSCTGMLFTDQIKIYETCNIIETHIASKPVCSTWNSGQAIHGLCKDNTLAHIVPGRNAPTMWEVYNDGYKFTPDPTNPNNYILEPIPYNPFLMNVSDTSIKWFTTTDTTVIGTGPNLTVSPMAPTQYVAMISSGGDCNAVSVTDTINIDFNATYYDTTTASMCAGSVYNFHGSIFNTPGLHTVFITNALGCDTFYTVDLTILPLPNVEISTTETSICEGQSISLSALSPSASNSYMWTRNSAVIPGANTSNHTDTIAGKYRMIATGSNGCKDSSRVVNVEVNPAAVANILEAYMNYDQLCIGDTILLKAEEFAGYEYRWSPEKYFRYTDGNQLPKVRAVVTDEPSEIYLRATNQFGCVAFDTVTFFPKPCCEVLLPTVFSPNADGLNDNFNIMMQPGQVVLSFQIFDRYGNIVYNNGNPKTGWDGTYLGKDPAVQGTYFFRILYSCTDGKNYEKKGDVVLVR